MNSILKDFKIADNYLGHYIKLITDVVVPYQEKIIKDEIPGIEKSHAVQNFIDAAQTLENGHCDGEFYGMVFQDSDVAKWLEAAAYSLLQSPDKELEKRCDDVIDIIGRAQHENGYLNTYFTVKEPNREWTNLYEAHELYCAGHMMEAAVAYYECTGKRKLLDIMSRMADHMYNHFIVEKRAGYPGHPECELALVRLSHATHNDKYMELASHFINTRGTDNYFENEYKNRDWTVWGNNPVDKEYSQIQAPVKQQTKAVGHAVRAVYLYSGMADIARETKDKELFDACKTLFNNIVNCRMYVTGAIGSAYEGEAFTKDYHLPNDTAYAETCAAVGLIFFARRMLDIEKKSVYANTMERALYNCVLAGMEQDGKKFFYVNPLEVIPGISGEAKTHPHTLPQRPEWFACACCPPNVARLLTSIANYAWSVEDNNVYSHLYIGGELKIKEMGNIKVTTKYPVNGEVMYSFIPENECMSITLALRIPDWCKKYEILFNGQPAKYTVKEGYAYICGQFTSEDMIALKLDMSVNKVYASEKVADDSGKVCLMRGPLVYCAEGVDNNDEILGLSINKESSPEIYGQPDFYGNYRIKAKGMRTEASDSLYSYERPTKHDTEIYFIPYYCWGNRGLNQMRVWILEN